MIVAIHQPNLFPRIKVLQKLALADIWIVLDDVQFARREYQNRTLLVPNHSGSKPHWFTLPVTLPFGRSTPINQVQLTVDNCIERINKSLSFSFKATSEFQLIRDDLLYRLQQAETSLVDLGITSTIELLRIAGSEPLIVRSSSLGVKETGKTERLTSLCKQMKATVYLADSGGTGYLEEEPFDKVDIKVLWHIWRAPLGPATLELRPYIRDGSALNLLARSKREFVEAVATCFVSRQRHWAEKEFENWRDDMLY